MADRSKKSKRRSALPLEESSKFWPNFVEPKTFSAYIPQLRDQVVYLRQGHEAVINGENSEYRDENTVPLPWNTFPDLPAALHCEVVGIEYAMRKNGYCKTRISLHPRSSGSPAIKPFKVEYMFYEGLGDYLVLKDRYNAALSHQWKIGHEVSMYWDETLYRGRIIKSAPSNPKYQGSPWERYEVKWHGYSDQATCHSPWEFMECEKLMTEKSLDEPLRRQLVEKFEKFTENPIYYDLEYLPPSVPYRVSIGIMLERLYNKFYRQHQAFVNDLTYLLEKMQPKRGDTAYDYLQQWGRQLREFVGTFAQSRPQSAAAATATSPPPTAADTARQQQPQQAAPSKRASTGSSPTSPPLKSSPSAIPTGPSRSSTGSSTVNASAARKKSGGAPAHLPTPAPHSSTSHSRPPPPAQPIKRETSSVPAGYAHLPPIDPVYIPPPPKPAVTSPTTSPRMAPSKPPAANASQQKSKITIGGKMDNNKKPEKSSSAAGKKRSSLVGVFEMADDDQNDELEFAGLMSSAPANRQTPADALTPEAVPKKRKRSQEDVHLTKRQKTLQSYANNISPPSSAPASPALPPAMPSPPASGMFTPPTAFIPAASGDNEDQQGSPPLSLALSPRHAPALADQDSGYSLPNDGGFGLDDEGPEVTSPSGLELTTLGQGEPAADSSATMAPFNPFKVVNIAEVATVHQPVVLKERTTKAQAAFLEDTQETVAMDDGLPEPLLEFPEISSPLLSPTIHSTPSIPPILSLLCSPPPVSSRKFKISELPVLPYDLIPVAESQGFKQSESNQNVFIRWSEKEIPMPSRIASLLSSCAFAKPRVLQCTTIHAFCIYPDLEIGGSQENDFQSLEVEILTQLGNSEKLALARLAPEITSLTKATESKSQRTLFRGPWSPTLACQIGQEFHESIGSGVPLIWDPQMSAYVAGPVSAEGPLFEYRCVQFFGVAMEVKLDIQ